MKKNIFFKLLVLVGVLSFTGCQTEDTETTITTEEFSIEDSENIISEKILNKLKDFYLNHNYIKKVTQTYPDGTSSNMYEVEGDIMMSEKQIMNLDIGGGITTRQYQTNNLVNQGMRIRVLGWTGSGLALNSNAKTALNRAVRNFRNLGITFSLSFGTNQNNADIIIYDNSNARPGASGGKAGFPHNGRPHKWIEIFGLGTNERINEHVISHEIGHAIGLRHSDWWTRESCPTGQQGNEGTGWQGAIHIPGTPTGVDPTSTMRACFDNSVTGEFNRNDIIALEFLYP